MYTIQQLQVERSRLITTHETEFELIFKSTTILQECMASTLLFYGFVVTEFAVINRLLGGDTNIMGMIHNSI